jgi:protein tyrosine phosphatase
MFTGIGRTGTFCAVDIALRRLHAIMADKVRPAAAKQAVDLKFIVQCLRRQRGGMVQNKSQYLFCHQVRSLLQSSACPACNSMSTLNALAPPGSCTRNIL